MRIILDTNEYIFGLDSEAGEVAPGRVLDAIRIYESLLRLMLRSSWRYWRKAEG